MDCHCGSKKAFSECCEPLLNGTRQAESAESLMRSRYSAYVEQKVPYLIDTVHASKRSLHHPAEIARWSRENEWDRLEILRAEEAPGKNAGIVHFKAWFYGPGRVLNNHEEISRFAWVDGRWYYVDGSYPQRAKIGRNDRCYCGSGKKFKHCHGK